MTVWFTADLHLGHRMLAEKGYRPWPTVAEMNAGIIERWNATVGPSDTVYVLGDVCMGPIAETLPLVGQLAGSKVLVPGNHDRVWPTYWPEKTRERRLAEFKAKYAEVFDHIMPAWAHVMYSWPIAGHYVQLGHLPFEPNPKDSDREAKLAPYRPVDRGGWLLHGHVHEAWKVRWRQINVGVDVWDYTPVSAEAIATLIEQHDPGGTGP